MGIVPDVLFGILCRSLLDNQLDNGCELLFLAAPGESYYTNGQLEADGTTEERDRKHSLVQLQRLAYGGDDVRRVLERLRVTRAAASSAVLS